MEWTTDFYTSNSSSSSLPAREPLQPGSAGSSAHGYYRGIGEGGKTPQVVRVQGLMIPLLDQLRSK